MAEKSTSVSTKASGYVYVYIMVVHDLHTMMKV